MYTNGYYDVALLVIYIISCLLHN